MRHERKGTPEDPIGIVRRWIEEEIVGNKLCIPLVRLANGSKDENGKINWQNLAKELSIQNFYARSPNIEDIKAKVAAQYAAFIREATINPEAPSASMMIVPDFPSNSEFDEFINSMLQQARIILLLDGTNLLERIVVDTNEIRKHTYSIDEVRQELTNPVFRQHVAGSIVTQTFRPIVFYGQPLKEEDLQDFPDDKGRIERAKVVTRGPYNIITINNQNKAEALIRGINFEPLRERNTEYAKEQLPGYEQKMRGYRTRGRR